MKSILRYAWSFFLVFPLILNAAESEPAPKPGIKALQLATEQNAIEPGKPFSIGLSIQHLPKYHTYWKAPGIVGVPTSITWDLPKGWNASPITWPVPQLTKMAEYTAYGYEKDVCLLSRITVPAEFTGQSVTIKARVAFMCCARTCHPGWHDLELTLPIIREGTVPIDKKWEKVFAETRRALPTKSAPESWVITVEASGNSLRLNLNSPKAPFSRNKSIYCFSENNQINSDKEQLITLSPDKNKLTFVLTKSEFGPKNQDTFPALLYHPDGWPGTNQKWITISVPIHSSS